MTDAPRKVGGRPATPATPETWVDLDAAQADLARDPLRAGAKLSPERVEAICAAIATGRYAQHACASHGVSEDAWADWRQRAWVAEAYGRAHASGIQIRIARCEAHEDAKVDLELLRAADRAVFDPPKERRPVEVHTGGIVERQVIIMTEAQMRERARASMRASPLPALSASGTVDPEGDE